MEIITKYWIEWICGIFALALTVGFKHYLKLQRRDWNRKVNEVKEKAKTEVITKLEEEIGAVREESRAGDAKISAELECLSISQENITAGLLSLQGKQFRETCLFLLQPDHLITFDEYEQFEQDYLAYKALGGNHYGDALHDRVVERYSRQIS